MSATVEEPGAADAPSRSRLRLGIVIAVVCGAIAFLLVQGLGNATTYFYNADEVAGREDELEGRRLRLQGTVVPGSVDPRPDGVAFAVEYGCEQVAVVHQGDPKELFRPGIPVVLEGAVDEGGTFASDNMFVRHTSEYREDEGERLELAADESCPS